MKKNPFTRSAFFNLRSLFGFTLGFLGVALAIFAHFSPLTDPVSRPGATDTSRPPRYMPVPGNRPGTESADLGRLEQFWNDRLTYPTGRFDPAWLRASAPQHSRMSRGIPAGIPPLLNRLSPLALSPSSFTALGPQPERMTGCSGCYDYTTTE